VYHGDEVAMQAMVKYCRHDVVLLAQVFEKLLPHVTRLRRLVDGEGSIRATTDSEVLRFRTGPGYVDVSDVRLGVVIEIPRSLRAATVEVDGRVFWRKDGDGTRALQPSTEEPGGGIVFRGRS